MIGLWVYMLGKVVADRTSVIAELSTGSFTKTMHTMDSHGRAAYHELDSWSGYTRYSKQPCQDSWHAWHMIWHLIFSNTDLLTRSMQRHWSWRDLPCDAFNDEKLFEWHVLVRCWSSWFLRAPAHLIITFVQPYSMPWWRVCGGFMWRVVCTWAPYSSPYHHMYICVQGVLGEMRACSMALDAPWQ